MVEVNTKAIEEPMTQAIALLPPDDLQRKLALARPVEDGSLPHIGLVGDTYTILLSGKDTNGRYCLIDMHIPPGGGPPPHRHDFEESFTVLEGEIETVFRGEKGIARAGETVNIPANAPHQFHTGTRNRRVCCAYVRPPVRKSFLRKSAFPLRPGRPRRLNLAKLNKRR